MNAKGFLTVMVYGAATTLGSHLMMKGIEVSKDPYKKAQLKRKVKSIKNKFIGKEESYI